MKIAVIITGHVRGWQHAYNGIKNCLLPFHEVDIYISTWSVNNQGRSSFRNDWYIPEPINLTPVINLFNPKKISIMDHNIYYQNRFPPIDIFSKSTCADYVFKEHIFRDLNEVSWWIERVRDMWVITNIGFKLIDNPTEYDLIIRQRSGLVLDTINLKQTGNIMIPSLDHGGSPANVIGINDHIAYGPPEAMKIYSEISDWIEPMYVQDHVNILHTNLMLKTYLEKYRGINPQEDNIRYHLREKN